VIRALSSDVAAFTVTTTGSPTTNYPSATTYTYWQFNATGSIALS
jgi:hypothetical protein